MNNELSCQRFRVYFFVVAILAISACFLVPNASAQQSPTGDLSVVGEVSVNGTVASTGDIVASGSTVQTTGQNSSAVVSLGKLGRVEVQGNTLLQLFYDVRRRTITIMLDAGSVAVSTGTHTKATVTRR
jgi:hypothetical protein